MRLRLDERDLAVIRDTARFRGISLESIRQVHFDGSTYAWKRLNTLYENGYLGRKYYYALHKAQSGIKHAQRVAALYFPTPKGLKTINYTIDARYVVPDDKKLDVHNIVSRLYSSIPGLLSKREALEKYAIKNFMPVSCVVPTNPPVFICILGKNKSHGEESRLIKFIDTKIFSGTYIAVSRDFLGKKLLLTDSHFIHWDLAPEVIPKMIVDEHIYLDTFINKFNGVRVLAYKEPFAKVQTPEHGVFYFAELFTGSTRLMLSLKNPPENTYIYVKSIKHLHGVKLESGSFYAYASKDGKLYKFYVEDGKMKHQLLTS